MGRSAHDASLNHNAKDESSMMFGHWLDPALSQLNPDRYEQVKKKAPAFRLGLQCLIAVITLRHLLREVKQGMTTSRLSFTGQFS
jgi:hypothetical protein